MFKPVTFQYENPKKITQVPQDLQILTFKYMLQ